jgi:hypothetical protein
LGRLRVTPHPAAGAPRKKKKEKQVVKANIFRLPTMMFLTYARRPVTLRDAYNGSFSELSPTSSCGTGKRPELIYDLFMLIPVHAIHYYPKP